uniref:Uncharacterized protein n=1 Tax=Panagrolaimus davidi TaxID=227884 RepID=A0A914QRA9_9BILA
MTIFNPKDAKYKCCLELLHVKTAATIIYNIIECVQTAEIGTLLLCFTVRFIVEYCFYDIFKKCQQYIIDKNAHDELTVLQSKVTLLPPSYKY